MKPRRLPLFLIGFLLFTMACMCTGTSKLFSSTPTPAGPVSSPANAGNQPKPSGMITEVVLAKDTQGESKDPVDPTQEFAPNATIHAVVKIENAPDNTSFKATWYVVDVGSAAEPNSVIDTTELVSKGTRNLDFTLAPTGNWPAGKYKVEIYVNGTLDQFATYTIQYKKPSTHKEILNEFA